MQEFRCDKCHKLLAKYLECRELSIKCPRCGRLNSLPLKVNVPNFVARAKS
ncbi:MAG TPA: Com family DNA-binding transcriptional regulator [Bacillota bacterium]|nr:Com family DNA-binding transcriptional regulator [Bacillota bacterium]